MLQAALNLTTFGCLIEKRFKGYTDALNCEGHPLFADNIIFELHSDDNINYTVKILHDGTPVALCDKN